MRPWVGVVSHGTNPTDGMGPRLDSDIITDTLSL
jgi:hypothetical protein